MDIDYYSVNTSQLQKACETLWYLEIPFSLSTAGQNLFCERPWLLGRTELPYRRQKTPRMRRKAAFGVFCLTTVYPIYTTGVHGNSGGKMAGKDVFASGKGRKCPETSGNRYSGFLWERRRTHLWLFRKSSTKPYTRRFQLFIFSLKCVTIRQRPHSIPQILKSQKIK